MRKAVSHFVPPASFAAMLDFAHDDRLFPRSAAQPVGGRGIPQANQAETRAERVARLKAQVQAGTYLTDAKLDAALERMIATTK